MVSNGWEWPVIELCCSHCGFGIQMLRLAGPKQFSQYTLQMPWKLKDNVRRFSLRVPLTVFQTSFATIQINLPRILHSRSPARPEPFQHVQRFGSWAWLPSIASQIRRLRIRTRLRSAKISVDLFFWVFIIFCRASQAADQDEEASAYPSFLQSFGNGQG